MTAHVPNRRKLRGGGYDAIHRWLRKYYGRASRCENPDCKHTSNIFHWALIKGKKHDHKAENYHQLCVSCHKSYDITEEQLQRLRTQSIGLKHTPQEKEKIRRAMLGRKITWGEKISLKLRGVGKKIPASHHHQILRRIKQGHTQTSIAKDYGCDQSTISKLIKKYVN